MINNIKSAPKTLIIWKNTENNHDATGSRVSLPVQKVTSLAKKVVIISGTE
jgi:hypothetical protein